MRFMQLFAVLFLLASAAFVTLPSGRADYNNCYSDCVAQSYYGGACMQCNPNEVGSCAGPNWCWCYTGSTWYPNEDDTC